MEKKSVYGLRKYGKQLVAVALGIVALGSSQLVSADTWVANSPDSIQVEAGATSYQLKWGDTLWAVSQKVNVSVEKLAELSNVDLASGQQYYLPVGYTVRWNAEKTNYQLVDPEGNVTNEVKTQAYSESVETVNEEVIDLSKFEEIQSFVDKVCKEDSNLKSSFVKVSSLSGEDIYVVPSVKDGENNNEEVTIIVVEPVRDSEEDVNDNNKNSSVSNSEVEENVQSDVIEELSVKEDVKKEILYSFMTDGKDIGWRVIFYTAPVDDVSNLTKLGEFSPSERVGRDPSLYYKDGVYYLATTNYSQIDVYDIAMYRSTDLVNWESFKLDLGFMSSEKQPGNVWAPDFIEDKNGDVYIVVAVGDKPKTTDIRGDLIRNHTMYMVKMDMSTLSALSTTKMNLPEDVNFIDGSVILKDDTYYLTIKDDNNKNILLYTSDDLENWELQDDDLVSTALGRDIKYAEGNFVLNEGENFYLYFDKYISTGGLEKGQYVVKTKDFKEFSDYSVVTDDENNILRHGNGIVIASDELRGSDEIVVEENVDNSSFAVGRIGEVVADGEVSEESIEGVNQNINYSEQESFISEVSEVSSEKVLFVEDGESEENNVISEELVENENNKDVAINNVGEINDETETNE